MTTSKSFKNPSDKDKITSPPTKTVSEPETAAKPAKSGSKRITKTEAQQSSLSRKQKKLITRLNSAYCRTGKMERVLPILTGKSKISLRLIDWFVTNYAKVNNTHYNLAIYKVKREEKESNKTVAKVLPKGIKGKKLVQPKTTQKKNDKDAKSSYFHDLFFVYPSYRQELKTNSKKRFDVFCRNGSINYYYDDKKFIETNDGQLNFFDWADNTFVIDYIEDHYDEIEKDMEARNAKKSKSQKKGSAHGKKKAKTIAVCTPAAKETESQKASKRREISESALKTVHHIPHRAIISFD